MYIFRNCYKNNQAKNQALESKCYFLKSNWSHFKERVTWVVLLAAIGLLSGIILHTYETALERLIILALYIPMVADTGGNVGSQSAAIVVRGLATGELKVSDLYRVIGKEFTISLLLAFVLGSCAYLKVFMLSGSSDIPEGILLSDVAIVISTALFLQVVTSALFGSIVPIISYKYGYDPANMATPALTTIVDITGLLIFFNLARYILGGF